MPYVVKPPREGLIGKAYGTLGTHSAPRKSGKQGKCHLRWVEQLTKGTKRLGDFGWVKYSRYKVQRTPDGRWMRLVPVAATDFSKGTYSIQNRDDGRSDLTLSAGLYLKEAPEDRIMFFYEGYALIGCPKKLRNAQTGMPLYVFESKQKG